MNESKYRAWDNINNTMLIYEEDNKLMIPCSLGVMWLNPSIEENNYVIKKENFIMMHFTGLTDKTGTGKEVYKGDLFEVVYSNVPNGFEAMNFKKELKINIGEVVFKFGGFKIKTFHPDHKEYVYMDLHTFLKNDEKVVIGNVHQNQELLES